MQERKTYSLTAVAKHFQVSKQTIKNWIRRGEIPKSCYEFKYSFKGRRIGIMFYEEVFKANTRKRVAKSDNNRIKDALAQKLNQSGLASKIQGTRRG